MLLARLAGFEPTTPWFVAKYSIQLSYRRDARIIAEAGGRLLLRLRPPPVAPDRRHFRGKPLDVRSFFDYP